MATLPIRLQNDPILEAVFELRFKGAVSSVADIHQAALFTPLKGQFPKVVRTPFSAMPVPEAMLEASPAFRYQPRLELQGERLSIFIGDHSFIVSCRKPYVGWTEFRPLILEVLKHVKEAAVTGDIERFSLKYINLLPGGLPSTQFKKVQYSATLGNLRLTELITSTRTEFEKGGFTNIVELVANATTKSPPATGLLIAIDTICSDANDFWVNYPTNIDKLHDVEKSIFFEILTTETIEQMGAVWAH